MSDDSSYDLETTDIQYSETNMQRIEFLFKNTIIEEIIIKYEFR